MHAAVAQDDRGTPVSEPPNVSLTLSNQAENVLLVRETLSGMGETVGVDGVDLHDIRTAVTEACNNVVLHAYPSTPGPLIFSLAVHGDSIEAVVRDQGTGIRPGAGRNRGLGMGVTLINALADRAEFESSDLGTEVRMHFKRSVRVPGSLADLGVRALTDSR